MSYLAGLLRRELPAAAPDAGPLGGGSLNAGSTTPEGAVVPRLASRFEEPGAPLWPGSGNVAAPMGEDAGPWARGTPAGSTRAAAAAGAPAPEGPAMPRPAPGSAPAAAAAPRPGGVDAAQAGAVTPPAVRERRPLAVHAAPPGAAAANRPDGPVPAVPQPDVRPDAAAPGRRHTPVGDAGQLVRPAGVVRAEATGWRPAGVPAQRHTETPAPPHDPEAGTVRPRMEPLARREASRAPEQHIHVHIGRIEVKAVAAPAQRPAAGPPASGLMSLDEYLKGRR